MELDSNDTINPGRFPGCSENVSFLLEENDPGYLAHRYSYITILLSLAGSGVVLNLLMIWFLVVQKIHRHSPLHLLVLQMAVANIAVAIFCLFSDGIWNLTIEWHGGDVLCRGIKFLQMFSLYATTLLLTGMSIETCITISFPLTRSNRIESFCRVRFISGFAWSGAAFCSVPQAIIFHTEQAPICVEFVQCVTHGFYSSPAQELAYTVVTLCLMGIVPLTVIIMCFAMILIKLSREAQMALGDLETGSGIVSAANPTPTFVLAVNAPVRAGKRVYQKSRQVSLWLTLITGALFAICWVPYYISMFGYLFRWDITHETLSRIFCFGMGYCVANPLLYGGFLLTRRTIRHNRWKAPK